MADVYNFIVEQGLITTDAGEILSQVSSEYQNTFGQDLVVPDSTNIEGASTPQGLLIVSETLARIAVADNNAAVANQINPNLAGGIFLDSILALTGLQRTPATPSSVLCTLTGIAGTSIPAGSQAATVADGSLFNLVTTTVIPIGGTISNVLFRSNDNGPVVAAASDLLVIISDVLGWETIINPAEAVLGTTTQTDISSRTMRLNTLAGQGSSTAGAIISGVSKVLGFNSMTFLENPTSSTAVYPIGDMDGVSMVPNSIYACVSGGTDLDVANALVSKKSAGAAYNNTAGDSQGVPVSQDVTIPYSGQVMTVLFDRPALVPILVDITVTVVTPVSDPVDAVKNAILLYASGGINGVQGLVVGQNVSAFEIGGAVTSQYPGIFVQQVLIAVSPTTPVSSDELIMQVYQQATIIAGNISVHLS